MTLEKNMKYKISFHRERLIQKDISKIPQNNIKIIFDTIEFLAENWLPNLQLKRLSNYKLANYRLRVWNYRVLFDIDDENIEIMVFRILHRSKLY